MTSDALNLSLVDPVFVTNAADAKVELRIGESYGSRIVYLNPSEARVIAYALLTAAERATLPRRTFSRTSCTKVLVTQVSGSSA